MRGMESFVSRPLLAPRVIWPKYLYSRLVCLNLFVTFKAHCGGSTRKITTRGNLTKKKSNSTGSGSAYVFRLLHTHWTGYGILQSSTPIQKENGVVSSEN